jgi:hypothetical protein
MTILNGTRKMYALTEMNEAQDDALWETDRAQIAKGDDSDITK